MTNPISGITGTDGIVPVYQPNSRWTQWNYNEIYFGQEGESRYVPKVDDYVIKVDTNETFRVAALDPSTLVPTLVPVANIINPGDLTEIDLLLGVGPGTQSDTYRVYLDRSVIPFTLAVDARLRVAASTAAYARIFKGSDLTNTGEIISAFYDQSGTLLGQSIPLELAASPNGENFTIRTVPVCYTTQELPDGEVVTAVFYSSNGHVISKRQLLIENTAFIRSSDSALRYITGISLETPFLSQSDPLLIQYPLNVPLNGLTLVGVVHYSDGSVQKYPVDGTKFEVFGLENFVATVIGQKIPVVLKYNLSSNEIVYGSSVGENRHISLSLRAITINSDGAYTTKLFGYPVWIDSVNGYRLEWYLYNLERNVVYHATPYVRINTNTLAFNPIGYGTNQRLSVTVNLREVNGTFTDYNHVQTIDIILVQPGTARTTNWKIGFDPGQNPLFGENNSASTTLVNQSLTKVRIGLGETTQAAWLSRLYSRTIPLVDPSHEVNAPVPTHFALVFNDVVLPFPISQWNTELMISHSVPNNSTLFVKFFLRTVDTDLELAMAALPVYQVS